MGHLYELGLYQDDLGVLMRVQKDLFVANLKTLVLTLPALLALIPPAVLILLQLEARLQHPTLEAGDTVLVEAVFDAPTGAVDPLSTAQLTVGEGLSLDSPRVRDYAERTVWWRVKIDGEGWHEATLVEDGHSHPLAVKAADGLRRHALKRERHGWFSALGIRAPIPSPAEGALIRLEAHPEQPEPEWWEQGWFWWFCGISIVGGWSPRGGSRSRFKQPGASPRLFIRFDSSQYFYLNSEPAHDVHDTLSSLQVPVFIPGDKFCNHFLSRIITEMLADLHDRRGRQILKYVIRLSLINSAHDNQIDRYKARLSRL